MDNADRKSICLEPAPLSSSATSSRSGFLQATRFAAAALVLVTHTTFYYHQRIDASVPVWHLGEIGVPIFFVISGFVIVVSSRPLTRDPAGARKFMARRLLRVVPLYWVVTLTKVLIALSIPAVVLHNHFDLAHAAKSFLFIPAYNAAGEVRPIHGVGWTLLHEMAFYLVFALMMAIKTRPALASSLVFVALYGLGLAHPPGTAFLTVVTSPINLYFVIGMALGSALVSARPWVGPVLIGALVCAAIAKQMAAPWLQDMPLDPLVLLTASALLALAPEKMPRALHLPVQLGNSSYALYLLHPLMAPPLLLAVHRFAPGLGAAAEIALAVALTVVLAHAAHRWVELPLNRWAKQALPAIPQGMRPIGNAT